MYVEGIMEKGRKGIIIFHECDYFKEQLLFHKDGLEADKWVKAIQEEAQFFDINEKYDRQQMLGKGKFSQVYLCKSRATEEFVALKQIDKNELTTKEKEFLMEEI